MPPAPPVSDGGALPPSVPATGGGASSSTAQEKFELRLKDLKEILLTFEENASRLSSSDYTHWVIEQDRHLVRCFFEYLKSDVANQRVSLVMVRILLCLAKQYPKTRTNDPLILAVLKNIALKKPERDFRNSNATRLGCLAVGDFSGSRSFGATVCRPPRPPRTLYEEDVVGDIGHSRKLFSFK